ncbi:hypothetical protein AK830_g6872 [Neonectria ditissima]|uniref:Uncharacterized protein n=1 Tax=Neonectria ditissima TaxID=78410 RepID=A0A0P7BBF8_9HYPO|nr:hypothetical protein AK830_g6872 [Neonectria ditissima]
MYSSFVAPRAHQQHQNLLAPPGVLDSHLTTFASQPEHRVHRKKRRRKTALSLSLPPDPGSRSSQPLQNVSAPGSALPHQMASPDLPGVAALAPQHHRFTSRISPVSLDPASPTSSEARWELGGRRVPSADTIRGPTRDREATPPPLTPFPPWRGDSGDEWGHRGWQDEGQRRPKQQLDEEGHETFAVVRVDGRWLLSAILHGVVLLLQFVVALAVFSALMWVAVCKKSKEDAQFWEWLWNFASPSLVGILVICSAAFLAHEVHMLSAVAMLYLQCLILVFTTATSLVMWAQCIEERSRSVKGVLMGCNMFMWGLALFGFVRAVVIWKADADLDDERRPGFAEGRRVLTYGTFVPYVETDGDQ